MGLTRARRREKATPWSKSTREGLVEGPPYIVEDEVERRDEEVAYLRRGVVGIDGGRNQMRSEGTFWTGNKRSDS